MDGVAFEHRIPARNDNVENDSDDIGDEADEVRIGMRAGPGGFVPNRAQGLHARHAVKSVG